MKKILKIAIPLLLAVTILLSIGWYFFQYNTTFTRDFLLQQARRLEDEGKHDLAVWFYNLAYEQSQGSDAVAIELAQQFKAIGNYTKAEYTLSKAIEDGGSVELYIALCQTYVEQNKLRDAVMMLDKIADPAIKAQIDAIRPAAPVASAASGTYMQYISVEFTSEGALYVNLQDDYPSLTTDAYTAPIRLQDGQTSMFAVCVGENGLVSPLSVYHYVVGSVVEEVQFTDAAVELAVRDYLGVDENYVIYSNQLWDIAAFTIPEDAKSFADLKWMPYVEQLTILGGNTEDMQVLLHLSRLHELTISNMILSKENLKTIANIPLLRQLALQECSLSSIEPLSVCTQLTQLDLRGNAIRDLTPLSGMTQLETLNLHSNAVINPQAISNLTSLTELDLSYNYLATTAPLSSLIALTKLDLSSNGLMRLEGLDTLVELRYFAASYNNLIDVNILSNSTKLETLVVSNNTLLNIDVAAKLTNLVELDFSYNEVTQLPKFSTDCALTIINGSYNALSSLDRLSKLANLTHIYMDYADSKVTDATKRLTNVDALQYCPQLQEVHIYGTKVRNVSKLTAKGIFVQYTPL